MAPMADSIFEQPTEFEMVTALGFEYFKREKCDIVICEVGMGGEFDATNVILPPEVAILCNIGLDHTEVLGDTLEKIAATKSGIIKPGCDAVIYREQPSVEAVFEERCKKVGAKLHKANFDSIRLRSHAAGSCLVSPFLKMRGRSRGKPPARTAPSGWCRARPRLPEVPADGSGAKDSLPFKNTPRPRVKNII